MDDTQKALAIERLEYLGDAQVRQLHSTGGLPATWNLIIIEWLREKDLETQRRKEQSQGEQYQIAISSKKAAWIAAFAAIAATVVAVIGVAVTWFAWRWPHP